MNEGSFLIWVCDRNALELGMEPSQASIRPERGSHSPGIVRVAPEVSLDKAFDYLVPADMKVELGAKVRVPFGARDVIGYVIETGIAQEYGDGSRALKAVLETYPGPPMIPPPLISLAHWMAEYYLAPLAVAMRAVLPEAVRGSGVGFKMRLWVEPRPGLEAGQVREMLRRSPLQARAWDALARDGAGWLTDLSRRTDVGASVWRALEKKSLVTLGSAAQDRDPFTDVLPAAPTYSLPLNLEQAFALTVIVEGAEQAATGAIPRPVLLHGVTGSGKTEVYLQAIAKVIERGQGAIMLVPEIALTPQTVERFRARFSRQENSIAVLHSHLSAGERHDQWHAIREGRSRIVIGARSAIFAPVERLGLIVVDEEHEPSYKQDDAPHYHARDVAVVRANLECVPIVLGSATPSLESYHNALSGRYRLVSLPKRVEEIRLPTTHVLDLRQEFRKNRQRPLLATRLVEAIQQRLTRREQVILFLNRRGYASSLQCPACGHIEMSPTCSIPLTYHRNGHRLVCHLSGYSKLAPESCPECGFGEFRRKGIGTQKVEHEIEGLFPCAKIVRMDSDSMRGKHSYRDTLAAFGDGRIDILVGTQMIAKGLHFPRVTCVGIVHADMALLLPDFRASERVFQLITQVSGRSGRGDVHGEVFVQTFTPFHPAIQFARHHDYEGFAEQELEFRQALKFPPFRRAILVTWRGRDAAKTRYVAGQMAKQFRAALPDADVPDPAPAPLEKLHDEYRFHLLMRTEKPKQTHVIRQLRALVFESEGRRRALPDGVKMTVDVDPMSLI